VTFEHLEDFAAMVGIEVVHIDAAMDLRTLRNELRWNDVAYRASR
jgi:L-arabinose isomerase